MVTFSDGWILKILKQFGEPLFDVRHGSWRSVEKAFQKVEDYGMFPSRYPLPVLHTASPAIGNAFYHTKQYRVFNSLHNQRLINEISVFYSSEETAHLFKDLYPNDRGGDQPPLIHFACAEVDRAVRDDLGDETIDLAWGVALTTCLYTQCFVDMQVDMHGKDESSAGSLRMRTRTDNGMLHIIGLPSLFFGGDVTGYPYKQHDITVPVNIGTMKLGELITPSLLMKMFVSSVDELVDSGVGIDLMCAQCPTEYGILDAMCLDRLSLLATGRCLACVTAPMPEYQSALPPPF